MRLEIKTDGTQFRVAGPVKPKADYKDKDRQATTRDGEPIWTVRLDAIEPEREARETIWVEVAGEQPRLTFDGDAVVPIPMIPIARSGVFDRGGSEAA